MEEKQRPDCSCTEVLARMELLLQHHHDRLVQRLQPWIVQPWGHVATQEKEDIPQEDRACVNESGKLVTFNEGTHSYPIMEPSCTAEPSASITGSMRSFAVQAKNRMPSSFSTFSKEEYLKRIVYRETSQDKAVARASVRNASCLRCCRTWLRKQVRSSVFESLATVLILSNVIFSGVEVEYLAQTRSEAQPWIFDILTIVFAALFAVEIALRLLAEGTDFFSGKNNGYNVLDLFIVFIALIEVSIGMGGNAGGQIAIVRVVRLAKVVRVLRVARVMRHVRSLRILIYSVLNTLRSLFWTVVLLMIILFTFGMVFTQAAAQHLAVPNTRNIPQLEEYWGSLPKTVFTLFASISGGVDWIMAVTPLGSLGATWVGLFLMYFVFTYFAVLNVVTGVFCQTAIESASHDHEMAAQAQLAAKNHYVRQLQRLFKKMSMDETGTITLTEFEEFIEDEEVRAYFASIDLSVDEAFSLFKLLDEDEAHKLDIDTFVTGCLKLRGQAKSIDLAIMMYEARWNSQKCLLGMRDIRQSITSIRNCLSRDHGFIGWAGDPTTMQGYYPPFIAPQSSAQGTEEVKHAII